MRVDLDASPCYRAALTIGTGLRFARDHGYARFWQACKRQVATLTVWREMAVRCKETHLTTGEDAPNHNLLIRNEMIAIFRDLRYTA